MDGGADLVAGQDEVGIPYFLFEDRQLIELVLQASPAERVPTLAEVFDSIAASLRGRDA